MTLNQEIEQLLSNYKDKKLTPKLLSELKSKIRDLCEVWISAICMGVAV